MRLPNGYGSVYKLSGNRRKPYAARIQKGYDEKGHPIYKFIGYCETKKEALLLLAEYNKNPYDVDGAKVSFGELSSELLKRKEKRVSLSSYNAYASISKKFAAFEKTPIRELKSNVWQQFFDDLNLSARTQSLAKTYAYQVYQLAIERDIVDKNYISFVKTAPIEKSNIHTAFTEQEIDILFKHIFDIPFVVNILILIYTGMRPTELTEMLIENVHLDERYMVGGIKTKAGKNRIIPIHTKILPLIKHLYSPDKKYLIERTHSKKYSSVTFSMAFDKTCKQLGMNHLPHDGRHTFATLADNASMNKVSMQKIMGHSSNDIEESVYIHKSIENLVQAVECI